ncbi:unnamed protein product, partial [Ectocarpus sp. 12 AP-2014]
PTDRQGRQCTLTRNTHDFHKRGADYQVSYLSTCAPRVLFDGPCQKRSGDNDFHRMRPTLPRIPRNWSTLTLFDKCLLSPGSVEVGVTSTTSKKLLNPYTT